MRLSGYIVGSLTRLPSKNSTIQGVESVLTANETTRFKVNGQDIAEEMKSFV